MGMYAEIKLERDKDAETIYHKVLNVIKEDDVYAIHIGAFMSKEDGKDISKCIGGGVHYFKPRGTENLIKQAYEYLKAQQGFEEFVDDI